MATLDHLHHITSFEKLEHLTISMYNLMPDALISVGTRWSAPQTLRRLNLLAFVDLELQQTDYNVHQYHALHNIRGPTTM